MLVITLYLPHATFQRYLNSQRFQTAEMTFSHSRSSGNMWLDRKHDQYKPWFYLTSILKQYTTVISYPSLSRFLRYSNLLA